jgi:hypothetical protein
MDVVVVILVVVSAVAVFAIAAVVIGREARRLDAVAPRAVYDLEEAVAFVSERLPEFAAAQLTADDVRQLLRWHMAQLREKGLQPPRVVDRPQDIAEPVVVEEISAVGYLIGWAEQAGMSIRDEDVAVVVDAHLAYFEAIGAVGPPAEDPDVPLG